MSPLLIAAADSTSKTPFYVLGGLLAVWAVVVSALGINRPGFPSGRGAQGAVMGLSVLLVVAAMASAVAVS